MKILSQKKFIITSCVVILFLIGMHIITRMILSTGGLDDRPTFSQLLERFNLDNETGIGTWVNQSALLLVAVLILIISKHKYKVKDKFRYHWIALGFLFIYASLDEGTALHELASKPVQQMLGLNGGLLGSGWVLPALVIISVLIVAYLRFFLHLPTRFKVMLVLSLGFLVSGSIGGEIGAGLWSEAHLENTGKPVDPSFFNYFSIPAEEGFEMLGSALFIMTFTEYLRGMPQATKAWKQLMQP